MVKYCLDNCKTREMCDKAVDNFLLALKQLLVSDWFVGSEMIITFHSALFRNNDILFF